MRFQIIVVNPPFLLDKWDAENTSSDSFNCYNKGIPLKSKVDYAFIIHIVETLEEDIGGAAVIVPHSVLFRGKSDGKIAVTDRRKPT